MYELRLQREADPGTAQQGKINTTLFEMTFNNRGVMKTA